ncbi:MAG: hypothetical protein AAGJ11_12035 [Bacteroidota bacterium]
MGDPLNIRTPETARWLPRSSAPETRIEAGVLAAGVCVLRLDAGSEADVQRLTVMQEAASGRGDDGPQTTA